MKCSRGSQFVETGMQTLAGTGAVGSAIFRGLKLVLWALSFDYTERFCRHDSKGFFPKIMLRWGSKIPLPHEKGERFNVTNMQ